MSNQRQVAIGIRAYAEEYEGIAPLLYEGTIKQASYWMQYSGGTKMGGAFVFDGGYVDAPKAWYCSSNTGAKFQYNAASNPWPPKAGTSTRSAFAFRPLTPQANGQDFPIIGRYNMDNLGLIAMVADICDKPSKVTKDGHRSGLNVAFTDGHARWIPLKSIYGPLIAIPESSQSSGNNTKIDTLWAAFDKIQ